MNKATTQQAAKTRGQFRYNRAQVLFLTGMNDEQFNAFQIDTAKAWIETYWHQFTDADKLLNCIGFWRWWMYHWNQADDRRIIRNIYAVNPAQRLAAYRQCHQFIFDTSDDDAQNLTLDFRSMRKSFEHEMKKKTPQQ